MSSIVKMEFVEILVRDWDCAVKWYVEVLGMVVAEKLAEGMWCKLDFVGGGSSIALWQPEDESFEFGGQFIPIFVTEDIYLAREFLEKRGVKFTEDIRSVGRSRLITTFLDCEGNVLQLIQ